MGAGQTAPEARLEEVWSWTERHGTLGCGAPAWPEGSGEPNAGLKQGNSLASLCFGWLVEGQEWLGKRQEQGRGPWAELGALMGLRAARLGQKWLSKLGAGGAQVFACVTCDLASSPPSSRNCF